jgi:transposase-like protein
MEEKGRRRRRRFSEEFKRDAVELVRTTGRPIAQIARELGSTTPRWATGSAKTASIVVRPRS